MTIKNQKTETAQAVNKLQRTMLIELRKVSKKRDDGEDMPSVEDAVDATDTADSDPGETQPGPNLEFDASLSSELPVERYDWWDDCKYNEVLLHTPDALDLTRAADGLPFLNQHSAYDQIGIVNNVRLENGQTIGRIKFSRNAEAAALAQDVADGIRKYISIGYKIDKYEMDDTTTPPTLRATAWSIYEASLVTIPADSSVGIGRSAEDEAFTRFLHKNADAEKLDDKLKNKTNPQTARSEQMTTGSTQNAAPVITTADNSKPNFARLRELGATAEQIADIAERGLNNEDAMASLLTARKPAAALQGLANSDKREIAKRYSYARALDMQAEGKQLTGLEAEVHQEYARSIPTDSQRGGVHIPLSMRAALGDVSTLAGLPQDPTFVASEANGEIIDAIRTQSKALGLGASFYPNMTGELKMPKFDGDPEASWVGENPADDYVTTDLLPPTLVKLTPKLMISNHRTTKQLLSLSGPYYNADAQVRNNIAAAVAKGLDKAAFRGNGTNDAPIGLAFTDGVLTHDFENAGPSYSDIIALATKLRNSMKRSGLPKLATTAEVAGYLMQTLTSNTTAAARYLWDGNHDQGTVNGYQATTADNLGLFGTGGDEQGLIFGLWEYLAIGLGSSTEIVVDPYSLKKRGVIEYTAYTFGDVAVKRPEAFVVGTKLKLA